MKIQYFAFIAAAAVFSFTGCTNRMGQAGTNLLASTFQPGNPAQLTFTVQPTTNQASNQIPVQVTVFDNKGLVSPAQIPITISYTDSSSVVHYSTATSTAGVATFNTFSISAAAQGYTLTASSPGLPSISSLAFDITPGTAASLAFTVEPKTTFAGSAFPQQIAVEVLDATGNLVTSSSAPVTLAISTGGVLSGTQTATATNGVATFLGLISTKVGTAFTLTASSGTLTSAASSAFNITPGAEASIAFVTQPASTAAGAPFTNPVTVEFLDQFGNIATQATDPLTITTTNGGTALATTTTLTPANGMASTTTNVATIAGNNYTLITSASNVTSATSTPFAITPAAAAQLAFSVEPANGAAGTVLGAFQVSVTDKFGNLETNAATPISLALNGSNGQFTGTNPVNSTGGLATFGNIVINKAATGLTFMASSSGLTSATSTSFNVIAGAPSALLSTLSMSSSSVAAGSSASVTVTLEDQYGNPVSGITPAVGASGAGNTITQPGATNTSGQATGLITSTVAQIETLSLTTPAGFNGVTAVVTFIPGPASATQSSITAASSTAPVGTSISLAITLKDSFGNLINGVVPVLSASGSSNAITQPGATNTSGQTTAGITSTLAQTESVTFASPSGLGSLSAPVTFTGTPVHFVAQQIASGELHSCALSTAGNVYCWGDNTDGELGNVSAPQGYSTMNANNSMTPLEVSSVSGTGFLSGIAGVSAGDNYSCALNTSGNVFCWGANYYGQLGNGTIISSTAPVEVLGVGGTGFLSKISTVIAGNNATCALSTAGNVYCWGYNGYGGLGNNSINQSTTPVEVVGMGGTGFLNGITSISTNDNSSCAVSVGGNVYCWGYNGAGKLGNNSTTLSQTPVEVLGVGGAGFLSGITSVSVGPAVCALSSAGNVYCWGDNNFGELGNGVAGTGLTSGTPVEVLGVGGAGFLSGIIGLSVGDYFACALNSTGYVSCWGLNDSNQLGDSSLVNGQSYSTPVQVQGPGGLGLLSEIESLSAGTIQVCVANTSGSAYCWGSNSSGQMGTGTSIGGPNPQPVALVDSGTLTEITDMATAVNSCAVNKSGNVYCWGDDTYGEVGDPSLTPAQSATANVPFPVSGVGGTGLLSGISNVSVGMEQVCALSTAGNVYCWGLLIGYETYTDPNSPVEIAGVGGTGVLSNIVSIAASEDHTCAVNSSGNVFCWGQNTEGQLGNNSTTASTYPVEVLGVGGAGFLSGIKNVAVYWQGYTCATSMAGNVYCWGNNGPGYLGNGTENNSSTPVIVSGVGGTGTLSNIVSVSTGDVACALSSAGNVYCWGANSSGDLGLGNTSSSSVNPTPVEVQAVGGTFLSGITSISAGMTDVCAVSSTGNAYCWGHPSGAGFYANSSGQILSAAGTVLTGVTGVSAGYYGACAMTSSGGMYCWGYNNYGQLGNDSLIVPSFPVAVKAPVSGFLTGI